MQSDCCVNQWGGGDISWAWKWEQKKKTKKYELMTESSRGSHDTLQVESECFIIVTVHFFAGITQDEFSCVLFQDFSFCKNKTLTDTRNLVLSFVVPCRKKKLVSN